MGLKLMKMFVPSIAHTCVSPNLGVHPVSDGVLVVEALAPTIALAWMHRGASLPWTDGSAACRRLPRRAFPMVLWS